MNITDVLCPDCMVFDAKATSKEEVFELLSTLLEKSGSVGSSEEFKRAVWKRESMSMTGLQDGIAIPHGVSETVRCPAIAYARLSDPLAWESIDDAPVSHVFLLAIPQQGAEDAVHIRMLSTLARSLIRPGVIAGVRRARDARDLLGVLEEGELATSSC